LFVKSQKSVYIYNTNKHKHIMTAEQRQAVKIQKTIEKLNIQLEKLREFNNKAVRMNEETKEHRVGCRNDRTLCGIENRVRHITHDITMIIDNE